MTSRAQALATRLEQGAAALATFAEGMTDAEWRTAKHPRDKRPFGVIVHHVASVYPLEVEVARTLAASKPVTGVTWEGIAEMNAKHHQEHGDATKQEALALLAQNSKAAADAIRAFTDAELDAAAPISLYFDAPLTAQFFLEDHAVRHSYHHLARMREALGR
jgi:hypothetical protein